MPEQFPNTLDLIAAQPPGLDLSSPQIGPALAIFAHPDDEVLSACGMLPRMRDGLFIHVTDGAPRDGCDARAHGFGNCELYAAARRDELISAMALAGIGPRQLGELGFADQEASLHLLELAREVQDLITRIGPALVITHPYEGGHPDHDATAFGVHAACRLIAQAGQTAPPIVEAGSYHNGPNGIEVYCFLNRPGDGGGPDAGSITLTQAQCDLKRRMLECFASQQETLAYFPVGTECYRTAPQYDFATAPHEGTLFYENYPWGMTGARFTALAAEAMNGLGLAGRM